MVEGPVGRPDSFFLVSLQREKRKEASLWWPFWRRVNDSLGSIRESRQEEEKKPNKVLPSHPILFYDYCRGGESCGQSPSTKTGSIDDRSFQAALTTTMTTTPDPIPSTNCQNACPAADRFPPTILARLSWPAIRLPSTLLTIDQNWFLSLFLLCLSFCVCRQPVYR